MGKIIASAGNSILSRADVKAGISAAQGAVGTAALQPADWWLHTQDGQDYTMASSPRYRPRASMYVLRSSIFGAIRTLFRGLTQGAEASDKRSTTR
jgi:hypothetical protein